MDSRSTRINRAPKDSFDIRVDPEEPLVPALGMTLPNGLARILVQELANHRLRDRVDDTGVRTCTLVIPIRAAEPNIRAYSRSDVALERPHGVLFLGGNRVPSGLVSVREPRKPFSFNSTLLGQALQCFVAHPCFFNQSQWVLLIARHPYAEAFKRAA